MNIYNPNNHFLRLLKVSCTVLGMFVLLGLIIALYFIDPEQVSFFPACVIFNKTGLYCPSCGMTKALYNILHLNFAKAFKFNFLIFFLIPLGFVFIYSVFQQIFYRKSLFNKNNLKMKHALIIMTILLLFTILRNII